MALIETLISAVGASVAKTTLKRWLEDEDYARDISTSLLGILEKKIPNFLTRSKAERDFRRVAEQVGQQLVPFIENEAGDLPENEREAAALAVADTFEKARISDKTLFEADLDPKTLTEIICASSPEVTKDLGEATTALYEKILAECSAYVIEITSTLPSFAHQSTSEMLKREGQIVELVQKVLDELPKLRTSDNGRDADLGFENDYRRAVPRKLDKLQLFGVTDEASRQYSLSVAYITLTASRNGDSVNEDDDNGLDVVRVNEAIGGSQRILIRGEAGSGKTTLLQWLAVHAARQDFEGALQDWNGLTPYFVRLRRWHDGELPSPEQFVDEVARNEKDAMPYGWVNRQLEAGGLILIDGIDEVPDDRRTKVKEWIDGLVGSFEKCRIVVTSRPAAADEGWLSAEGFDDTELQRMDRADIEALIDQWHEAARQELIDEEKREQLDDYRDTLKKTVNAASALRNLAMTPLLCAMICALHLERRKNVPDDRMELYRLAMDMMLDRREKERGATFPEFDDLKKRAKESLLRRFAYWLMVNDRSDAKRREVENCFVRGQESLGDVKYESEKLTQFLLERSGLLREPIKDQIDFIHRTFQEYLAAKQAIDEQHVDYLIKQAHLAEWRETIILAAGHASQIDGDKLVGGLLQRADREPKKKHQLVLLAMGCLETASDLSPDRREDTKKRVGEIMPPTTITEARAVALAGDLALPYLKAAKKTKANVTRAIITALGDIGSDQAIETLKRFRGDSRTTVKDALKGVFIDLHQFDELISNGKLDLSSCKSLTSLSGIERLTSLKSLNLSRCNGLTSLSGVEGLTSLQCLNLSGCTGLTSLSGIERLTSLQSLDLSWCKGLTSLSGVEGLASLQSLDLSWCSGLTSLSGVEGLTSLQSFYLSGYKGLTSLSDVEGLISLQSLSLSGCERLTSLSGVEGLISLRFLYLYGCTGLSSLSGLENLPSLQSLDFRNCRHLTDLTPLHGLKQLKKVFGISGELWRTLPPDHPARHQVEFCLY